VKTFDGIRTVDGVRALFQLAGFTVTHSWRLENCYWPVCDDYRELREANPWWLLLTKEAGLIEIGPRKRVISIDWRTTPVRALVTTDDTTKSEEYVHAWTLEKALEYLRALRSAIGS